MQQSEILNKLLCPAFLVVDGLVVQVNAPAQQRNIEVGAHIADYISVGMQEYAAFTAGRLCLTLTACQVSYSAYVANWEGGHLFCLETEYDMPELRAFALAAQQLRDPLANAMAGTELLLPELASNDETLQHLAQVNRSLHQILRAVCNMSDAAVYKSQQQQKLAPGNLCVFLQEILENAAFLAEKANRKLDYKLPNGVAITLLDAEKLERAVLNMLSNAFRFSPQGSVIQAELKKGEKHYYFTVENKIDDALTPEPFSRYLREPGIESNRSGIGLGLPLIHSVATAHGGTVLMEQPEASTVRFTMTIAIRSGKGASVCSPVILPTDYSGEKNRSLLELSDVLPYDLFDHID